MEEQTGTVENVEVERPLDILKHFIFNNTEYKVTILWEDGEPLFRASEIGDVLGIKEMRSVIRDFDGDERRVHTVHTTHFGTRESLFLTEVGVYRVLFQSRKPIAKPFQKWVARVIKGIQRNGRYEVDNLKEEVQRAYALYEQSEREKEQAEEAEARAKRMLMEEKQAKQDALIDSYRNKRIVYFGRIKDTQDGYQLIKIGETKDVWTTFTDRHVKDYGEIEFLKAFECRANKEFEQFLLQHEFVRRHIYREPVKLNGGASIEVIRVTQSQLEKVLRIAKAHVHRYRTLGELQIELDEIKDIVSETRDHDNITEGQLAMLKKEVAELKSETQNLLEFVRQKATNDNKITTKDPKPKKSGKRKFEVSKEELNDLVNIQKLPFVDIGRKFGVEASSIRKRCGVLGIEIAPRERTKKTEKRKRPRPREIGSGICPGCDKKIAKRAQFCVGCAVPERKFEVTQETLYDMVHVQKLSFLEIGRRFGVSDNAIRKRCKVLGVEVRKRVKRTEA